jgi:uncharacterized protein YndB with AHSA1/START domain
MRKIEKTFTVGVPVGRAWTAFVDGDERSKWEANEYEIDPVPGGKVRWTLPGLESNGQVEAVEHERLLQWAEIDGPHLESEITVTFEAVDGGTRISITHAGFGDTDDWGEWIEGTTLGWTQAIADLIVYLEQGVVAGRFTSGMEPPGMRTTDTPGGMVVDEVLDGGWASQAGLQPGDLLLNVGGVAIYTLPEFWVLLRVYKHGDALAVDYVRNGQRLTGRGTLSATGWNG